MRIPRFIIAGLSGGSGKTMLSLGLARALRQEGLRVRAFKKGPDYIDAAWLALAADAPQANLDPFFLDEKALRARFASEATGYDCAVIEGNRGMFDGLDLAGACSTAALARQLSAPVILVLDCTKMTRTAGALVRGCVDFEPDVRIGGVICNRTGNARHQAMVRGAIEDLAGVPVLGVLPRQADMAIAERHMGLASPDEYAEAQTRLDVLANFVRQYVNLDDVLALARSAPYFGQVGDAALPGAAGGSMRTAAPSGPAVRIGYIRDAAFWFYYQENLDALRDAGAELVPLSLLDAAPWPALDGLYIGGGLPELHARQLADNSDRRAQVAALCRSGAPVYAECAGLMYLSQALVHRGERFPMAGVFPGEVVFCDRPQGLGYVEAQVAEANPYHPLGALVKGHEFHFSRYVPNQETPGKPVFRLKRGNGFGPDQGDAQAPGQYADGMQAGNTFACYTHIYAPAVPHWAPAFVARARRVL